LTTMPAEIAEYAVELATRLGARYADVRLERSRFEDIVVKDGAVESVKFEEESGLGIRVLAGTWGFASTNELTRSAVGDAVRAAMNMAGARGSGGRIELAEIEICEDTSRAVGKKDPFKVDLGERIELCLEADGRARAVEHIKRTSTAIACERTQKVFVSSEGARIESESVRTYAEVFALAKREGITEYADDIAGGTGGFEIVEEFDMPARAEEVGRRASALAGAKTLPRQKLPVVLDQDFVALLVHEIIGHPSEADRVLGREAAWAGKAWWAGKLGERVGSKYLNAVDDPRVEGALGYFEHDDEGTPAKRKRLIHNGVLLEHMHSRETAAAFGVKPNGGMRAKNFRYLPLIRMSNTFIEPGDFKREELFEIARGVYLKGAKIPSIDSRRYDFQISAEEAFLIERGELVGPFRDVSLVGVAPDFFESVDAVADDFEMRPIPNCGKGDPMQTLHVGNGGPHLRGKGLITGAR
jgi:TldD protein